MKINSSFWRVFSHGEENHPAGQPYWFINRGRPNSVSVVQYTLKGTLRFLRDGQEHLARKGQACLFNYNEESEYGIRPKDGAYSCFWISLIGAGLPEHWDEIRALYGSVVSDSDGKLLELLREIAKTGSFSAEQDTIRVASSVHLFVTRLIYLLNRLNQQPVNPVDQALTRLRNNPYYPWSVKELVEEEGCSREYFFRVFRERYGTTPAAWLSQQRAEHARHLLQGTRLTVEDVAQQCGFAGAHSLARTLRRYYQQGPNAIRHSFKT